MQSYRFSKGGVGTEIGVKDNDEIFFSYCYGDYARSTVAETPDRATRQTIVWSEYHGSHKVIEEDDRWSWDALKLKEAVVLE